MKTSSPLRYPGGKSAMADVLKQIRRLNSFGDRAIAEPFGGGAGAALTLLFLEESPEIFINDVDPAIHDFWWSLLNQFDSFAAKLRWSRASMAEWRRQREVYRNESRIPRVDRGFAAFYLNRCNRSGIIMNGGPIGGVDQTGEWKIGARYNKVELLRRCKKVSEFRDRISVSRKDGIEFIDSLDSDRTFFFIDPPYYKKGQTLYLNALDSSYHELLAKKLKAMPNGGWVLTYDDCPEVRALYRGWAKIKPFSLRYAASERRSGKELLIVPNWMRLPNCQKSAAVRW